MGRTWGRRRASSGSWGREYGCEQSHEAGIQYVQPQKAQQQGESEESVGLEVEKHTKGKDQTFRRKYCISDVESVWIEGGRGERKGTT